MKKKRETKNADKYDTHYRFRCYEVLKKRAARVAKARGTGDYSDIGREGVIEHVERWEKKLNLPPLKA